MSYYKDRMTTERVVKNIQAHRYQQKRFAFNDDAHVNSELLSAALAYTNVAKQQIRTRDMSNLKPRRDKDGKIIPSYVPTAGNNVGYDQGKQRFPKPDSWPFSDEMWAPSNPQYNLIRAAALIIAELERLERMDNELLGNNEKSPRAEKKFLDEKLKQEADKRLEAAAYIFDPSIYNNSILTVY